jgi:hypothetical protein
MDRIEKLDCMGMSDENDAGMAGRASKVHGKDIGVFVAPFYSLLNFTHT